MWIRLLSYFLQEKLKKLMRLQAYLPTIFFGKLQVFHWHKKFMEKLLKARPILGTFVLLWLMKHAYSFQSHINSVYIFCWLSEVKFAYRRQFLIKNIIFLQNNVKTYGRFNSRKFCRNKLSKFGITYLQSRFGTLEPTNVEIGTWRFGIINLRTMQLLRGLSAVVLKKINLHSIKIEYSQNAGENVFWNFWIMKKNNIISQILYLIS